MLDGRWNMRGKYRDPRTGKMVSYARYLTAYFALDPEGHKLTWHGAGAARLGLSGAVDPKVLEDLFNGKLPAGATLSEMAERSFGQDDSVALHDLVLKAPKWASLAWAMAGEEDAAIIEQAHIEAARAAMKTMAEYALARRGSFSRGTGYHVQAELIYAEAVHHVARSAKLGETPAMQLHTHFATSNLVYSPADGRWTKLDAQDLQKAAKNAGATYQAELRRRLHEELGWEFTAVDADGLADLEGISRKMIRHFSPRRRDIEAELEKYGWSSRGNRRAAQMVASRTRVGKEKTPTAQLRQQWESDLQATFGIAGADLHGLIQRAGEVARLQKNRAYAAAKGAKGAALAAVEDAARHRIGWGSKWRPQAGEDRYGTLDPVIEATKMGTHFERRTLFIPMLRRGLSPDEARTEIAQMVADAIEWTEMPASVTELEALCEADPYRLVRLGVTVGAWVDEASFRRQTFAQQAHFCSVETYLAEQRGLEAVRAGRAAGVGIVDADLIDKAIAACDERLARNSDGGRLSDEQRDFLRAACSDGSRVSVCVGYPGVGKTTVLWGAARAWRAQGHTVLGVATAAKAVHELEDGAQIPASTIESLWRQLEDGERLPEGCVLIIDETNMTGNVRTDGLLQAVDAASGKVLLVGDPKQLFAVEAGGLFHRVAAEGVAPVAELKDIIRQRLAGEEHAWQIPLILEQREATKEQAVEIVSAYEAHGALLLGEDMDSTMDAMVQAARRDAAAGHEPVLMAYRRRDVRKLNDKSIVAALAHGEITNDIREVGDELLAVGAPVVVRRADQLRAPLRAGAEGTIVSIGARSIKVLGDDGIMRTIGGGKLARGQFEAAEGEGDAEPEAGRDPRFGRPVVLRRAAEVASPTDLPVDEAGRRRRARRELAARGSRGRVHRIDPNGRIWVRLDDGRFARLDAGAAASGLHYEGVEWAAGGQVAAAVGTKAAVAGELGKVVAVRSRTVTIEWADKARETISKAQAGHGAVLPVTGIYARQARDSGTVGVWEKDELVGARLRVTRAMAGAVGKPVTAAGRAAYDDALAKSKGRIPKPRTRAEVERAQAMRKVFAADAKRAARSAQRAAGKVGRGTTGKVVRRLPLGGAVVMLDDGRYVELTREQLDAHTVLENLQWKAGQRIRATKDLVKDDAPTMRVANGDEGVILAFERFQGEHYIRMQITKGAKKGQVLLLPEAWCEQDGIDKTSQSLHVAYCSTVHRREGATDSRAYVLHSGLGRHSAQVADSRATGPTVICAPLGPAYDEDGNELTHEQRVQAAKEAIAEGMATEPDEDLAEAHASKATPAQLAKMARDRDYLRSIVDGAPLDAVALRTMLTSRVARLDAELAGATDPLAQAHLSRLAAAARQELADLDAGVHPRLAERAQWEQAHQSTQQRLAAMEDTLRRHEYLGEGVERPPGLPPAPALRDAAHEHDATVVAAVEQYRRRHNVVDPSSPLGPEPLDPELRRQWHALDRKISGLWGDHAGRDLAQGLAAYADRWGADRAAPLAAEPPAGTAQRAQWEELHKLQIAAEARAAVQADRHEAERAAKLAAIARERDVLVTSMADAPPTRRGLEKAITARLESTEHELAGLAGVEGAEEAAEYLRREAERARRELEALAGGKHPGLEARATFEATRREATRRAEELDRVLVNEGWRAPEALAVPAYLPPPPPVHMTAEHARALRLADQVAEYRRARGITDERNALGPVPRTREERAQWTPLAKRLEQAWVEHDKAVLAEDVSRYAAAHGLDPAQVLAEAPPVALARNAEWSALRDRDLDLTERADRRAEADRQSKERWLERTQAEYLRLSSAASGAPPSPEQLRSQLAERLAAAESEARRLAPYASRPQYAGLVAEQQAGLRRAADELAALDAGQHPGLGAWKEWQATHGDAPRALAEQEEKLRRHGRLEQRIARAKRPAYLPPEPGLLGPGRLAHGKLVEDIASYRTRAGVDAADSALGEAPEDPALAAEHEVLQARLEQAWHASRAEQLDAAELAYARRYGLDPEQVFAEVPDPLLHQRAEYDELVRRHQQLHGSLGRKAERRRSIAV